MKEREKTEILRDMVLRIRIQPNPLQNHSLICTIIGEKCVRMMKGGAKWLRYPLLTTSCCFPCNLDRRQEFWDICGFITNLYTKIRQISETSWIENVSTLEVVGLVKHMHTGGSLVSCFNFRISEYDSSEKMALHLL